MGHYDIQWEMVVAAPIVIGVWLIADYLDQWRNRGRDQKPKPMKEKKAAKQNRLFRKRKTGFRTMKSNAQRIRERMQAIEDAAANAEIESQRAPVSAPPSPRAARRGQSWGRRSGRAATRLP